MIVVTGLMRSGTSPLAQMLHQMGVPMGEFQRFPLFGTQHHFEWEDMALAEPLCQHLFEKKRIEDLQQFLYDYIVNRQVHFAKLRATVEGVAPTWGVKTPFLLPFLDAFRTVALLATNEPAVVALTVRPFSDTIRSLERQADGVQLEQRIYDLQQSLEQAMGWIACEHGPFPIEETHENPRGVAQKLAGLAGLDVLSDADLDKAVRGVEGWKPSYE